jgi:uncharacterized cupredoxin-like copper-binding protein
MHRKRSTMVLGLLGLTCTGLAAWFLGFAAGPAAGQVKPHRVAVPVINVTAGKPSELAFTISKTSLPAAGMVTFKVTNKGTLPHDFEVCTATTTTGNAFTCKGTKTPMIKPGKSATLTVKLSKGKHEFLCTVPGHAQAGMKGVFGAGVKVAATPTGGTTAPGNTTAPAAAGGTCASPQNTTVTVQEMEYKFVLSQTAIPCGNVTFNMTNTGQLEHNMDVQGVANGGGVGAILQPGQSSSMTVKLGTGSYSIVCDVPEHIALGMTGSITVS